MKDTTLRLNKDVKASIERTIRERLGDSVINVRFDVVEDSGGKYSVKIEIVFDGTADAKAAASRFFGLTGRVRDAMGEDMEDIFPVLRPTVAAANA